MKRIVSTLLLMAFAVSLSVSCSKLTVVNKTIEYISNGAVFRVTNLQSNEAIQNSGIVFLSSIEDMPHLDVIKGEAILLEYEPPLKYTEGENMTRYKIFGEEYTVVQKPYSMRLVVPDAAPIGPQLVVCNSYNSLWVDGSYDKGIVYLNIIDASSILKQ